MITHSRYAKKQKEAIPNFGLYRRLIMIGASLPVCVFMILPWHAFAADSFTNVATGTDSTNNNSATVSTTTNQTTNANTTTSNQFNLTIDTGDTTVSNNNEVGPIKTGDITTSITSVTKGNNGITSSSSSVPSLNNSTSFTASNTTTGEGSVNTNSFASITNNSNTTNLSASTENSFMVNAQTGGLTITHNTKVGAVTTGAVDVTIGTTTESNGGSTSGSSSPVVTPPSSSGGGNVVSEIVHAVIPVAQAAGGFGGGVAPATITNVSHEFFPAGSAIGFLPLYIILTIVSFAYLFDRFVWRKLNLLFCRYRQRR